MTKLPWALILACALLDGQTDGGAAKAPAPSPVPSAESPLTGWIDLGYRWQTANGGNWNVYRSLVNLGEGPKLIGADITYTDPKSRLFDRFDLQASGWGGEPYATIHGRVRKARLYELEGNYRDIAYFSNLPSFADPLLQRGLVLNEQSSDVHDHLTDVRLELIPWSWITPYGQFERSSETGNSVNTFVTGNNEYAVPGVVRNSQLYFRGGARIDAGRFHVTLEQGGSQYKDDQTSYQAASHPNTGNNIVPYFGQQLYLTSFAEAYGIRGSSIYSKALATAHVTSWLDLRGEFYFSQPKNTANYQMNDTGSFVIPSQILFYSAQRYALQSGAKLPHQTGSFGAELRPLRKVRMIESWLTDRLHDASNATAQQNPVTTASLLSSSLASNYTQLQSDVIFDASARLTLRGGYRRVWADANDLTLPVAGLAYMDHVSLHRNVGLAGATYKPFSKWMVHGDLEAGVSNGAYFRTSLYRYQRIRLRSSYHFRPGLEAAFDASILNNENPIAQQTGPAQSYSFLSKQLGISLIYAPEKKRWSLQSSYTRATTHSDIPYLEPSTGVQLFDRYRENLHIVNGFLEAKPWVPFGLKPALSLGGAFVTTSGSRPTGFYQPVIKLTMPLTKKIAWFSEWRYYGFHEPYYAYENFRSSFFTTGVRITR